MNAVFYKAWLPISLAVHVVLLFTLNIVPFGVPRYPGGGIVKITVIQPANAMTPPVGKKEEAKPPPLPAIKPLVEKPAPVSEGPVRHERANTREIGNQVRNPHINTGNAKLQGDGKVSTTKGPGVGENVAPSLISSSNGAQVVPEGQSGGTGDRNSSGLGPSGPSYGPKSKYGNSGGMSKAAGEINLVTDAVFTVQLSDSGAVSGVAQSKSTGNDELDRIAMRLIRARDYDPAMKNGQAVTSSLRIRVKFNSGAYSFADL